MKKSFLFALVLCIGIALSAQNIPSVSKSQLETMVKVDYRAPDKAVNPLMNYNVSMINNKGALALDETELGETWYDLQSNASIANRFQVWDDGTMAAVWTRGLEATAFPDRGTGYNFFDGAEWGPWPTARIEDRRCGWPSIAAWGETGEIVVVHNGVEGLEWSQRETKGTGSWTQTNFLGPAGLENDITWPRMITSGENNEIIHLFVNSYVEYMGQGQALLYSRSADGGETWDPHHTVLDGMGDDYYFELGADDYVLAARGNTVAMLYSSDWADMFMMKSDDNGETWEKTIIWEHPYQFFDWNTTITDTFFSVCNTANIALDPDGMAHVVFGISRVAHFDVGASYTLWPYYDGIGYWNEDMDPFSDDMDALAPPQYGFANSEMIEDVNYIGWMQDVDGDGEVTLNTDIMCYQQHGPSNMPTIGINEFGNIYVIYASTTETYEIDVYNYKHLWLRSYIGGVWGDFEDLTSDISHIFDECYYPVIGKVTSSTMHYIYNADITPGLAWDDDHAWQQNRIIYGQYDLPVGIGENTNGLQGILVELSPNPATNKVMVKFKLEEPADVSICITNMTGQMVKEVKKGQLNGPVNIIIEVSDLRAGTYVCTVKTGNDIATKKLIIK
ncbi:MAG: T9SS type A sorting domain-containing protein [Bacteroidales bacterium]|nr:T9SS type A sorting domain-containing protein [Bacteroidales bacterium]